MRITFPDVFQVAYGPGFIIVVIPATLYTSTIAMDLALDPIGFFDFDVEFASARTPSLCNVLRNAILIVSGNGIIA